MTPGTSHAVFPLCGRRVHVLQPSWRISGCDRRSGVVTTRSPEPTYGRHDGRASPRGGDFAATLADRSWVLIFIGFNIGLRSVAVG
jgi:hypothetical protein